MGTSYACGFAQSSRPNQSQNPAQFLRGLFTDKPLKTNAGRAQYATKRVQLDLLLATTTGMSFKS